MSTKRLPAALATALLLGTLSLSACVQQGGGTEDPPSPAEGTSSAEPAGQPQTPVILECVPTMPESVFQSCSTNRRGSFPRPPVQFQHRAE